jgi:hypothetical protein
LDDGDAEAHAVLGDVAALLDHDWRAAERHFLRARDISPSTQVRTSYIMRFLLPLARLDEALEECNRMLVHDPLFDVAHSVRAAVSSARLRRSRRSLQSQPPVKQRRVTRPVVPLLRSVVYRTNARCFVLGQSPQGDTRGISAGRTGHRRRTWHRRRPGRGDRGYAHHPRSTGRRLPEGLHSRS